MDQDPNCMFTIKEAPIPRDLGAAARTKKDSRSRYFAGARAQPLTTATAKTSQRIFVDNTWNATIEACIHRYTVKKTGPLTTRPCFTSIHSCSRQHRKHEEAIRETTQFWLAPGGKTLRGLQYLRAELLSCSTHFVDF